VIGRSIASRSDGFGSPIAWWGRHLQPDAAYPRKDTLENLAAWSDVLVVAARADDTNTGLIDRAVIETLGPGGLLINISRGSIVDEYALIAALKDGRFGAAALDVFETEPSPPERRAGVDNALLTPHSAGQTESAVPQMVDQLLENIRRFFAGEPVATPVPPL
jgi:lactate dehydrogenase-like 2-hydroxyacid dehydrogenase